MPCNDVAEILKINLDQEGKLLHYSLSKGTCGGGVGEESLLKSWLMAKPAEEIIDAAAESLIDAYADSPARGGIENFLLAKHLNAVQRGLAVLLGLEDGAVADPCVVDSINYGPEGIKFVGRLKPSLKPENIKSCGGCG
jgi:hypothetical protein